MNDLPKEVASKDDVLNQEELEQGIGICGSCVICINGIKWK
jgi:hypothetical protein